MLFYSNVFDLWQQPFDRIFVAWILTIWLVNIAKTFIDILKQYGLQMTVVELAKCISHRTTLKMPLEIWCRWK